MLKCPVFSIIIPTLNSGNTLSKCLQSIVTQSHQNIEVLIMDGLSTDNTLDIVKDYSADFKYIKTISERDNGIYDAMNKGIKISRGQWIYFLGSDDRFYNENVLANILDKIKITPDKIVYGNVLIDGDVGWAKNGEIYDGEFTLSKLIEKNICHQAMFYKKSVFKRGYAYNTKFTICADWDMNLKLWSAYPFTYLDKIVAVFKGGNSSHKIANNYTEIDKWDSIARYFKFRIYSNGFSKYYQNFLALNLYYRERHKYLKSFLMKIVLCVHSNKN